MGDLPRTVPCDKCGRPVVLGRDLVYTIADRYDERDVLVSSRHARCQPSSKQLNDDLDAALGRLKGAMSKLRRQL